jgi:hypothetical protein
MPSEEQGRVKKSVIAALAHRTSRWITNEPQGWKAGLVFALARRLPHCKQVAPLMSEALDHELPWRVRIKIRLHQVVCLACVRYEEQLRLLNETARRLATELEEHQPSSTARLSDDARERLKRALSGKRE